MELIRATEQELDELLAFYQHVADNMKKSGQQQRNQCFPNPAQEHDGFPGAGNAGA